MRVRRFGRMRRPFGRRAWRGPFVLGPFRWRMGLWGPWLWMGPFMLLLFGTAAYKLRQSDVQGLESQTGKSIADLMEDELLAVMKNLGIQKLELTEEDQDAIAQAE